MARAVGGQGGGDPDLTCDWPMTSWVMVTWDWLTDRHDGNHYLTETSFSGGFNCVCNNSNRKSQLLLSNINPLIQVIDDLIYNKIILLINMFVAFNLLLLIINSRFILLLSTGWYYHQRHLEALLLHKMVQQEYWGYNDNKVHFRAICYEYSYKMCSFYDAHIFSSSLTRMLKVFQLHFWLIFHRKRKYPHVEGKFSA